MDVTPAQALTLIAMYDYWNQLSSMGSSRYVGFMVDGDGDFHPNVQYTVSEADELPQLTDKLRKAAIVSDNDGDRMYDYDPVAWGIYEK